MPSPRAGLTRSRELPGPETLGGRRTTRQALPTPAPARPTTCSAPPSTVPTAAASTPSSTTRSAANNKFFIRNSWNRHRQLGRISAYITNSDLDSAAHGFGRPEPIDQQNWAFADYHTFSPTLMNEICAGLRHGASAHLPAHGRRRAGPQSSASPTWGPRTSPASASTRIGPGGYSKTERERGHHLPGQRDQAHPPPHHQVRLRGHPHPRKQSRRGAALG